MTRSRAWKVGGEPSAQVFAEDVEIGDQLVLAYVASPEDVDVADHFATTLAFRAAATVDDLFRVVTLRAELAEDIAVDDLFKAKIVNFFASQDTWTEQAAPTTTHGTEANLFVRAPTAVGTGQENGYVAFDLTKFASFTSAVDALVAQFRISQTLVGNQNLTYNIYRSATQPFDEATATWDTPPTLGTFIKTGTLSCPQTFTSHTISLTLAETTAALG